MKICYHGTNKRNAQKILKEGFRRGTYFAQHLEDALAYGGFHLFRVVFEDEIVLQGWQFKNKRIMGSDKIVSYEKYIRPKRLYFNKRLRQEVFESNIHQKNGITPEI